MLSLCFAVPNEDTNLTAVDLSSSIHAPLAGYDDIPSTSGRTACDFNPRTPCGVRRTIPSRRSRLPYFNPRTPCGVRPSIRAGLSGPGYFNPRTPCGVRPCGCGRVQITAKFQSTHPLRGATAYAAGKTGGESISIHAPLAGCDSIIRYASSGFCISIHAPLAGCDVLSHAGTKTSLKISIHAPLAGCDICSLMDIAQPSISIHAPLAGCDGQPHKTRQKYNISIHAPLAGCDSENAQSFLRILR